MEEYLSEGKLRITSDNKVCGIGALNGFGNGRYCFGEILQVGACFYSPHHFKNYSKMYNERFNLYVLGKKTQRLQAEINVLEKRLTAKKALLENVKFTKIAQEYRLSLLIEKTP